MTIIGHKDALERLSGIVGQRCWWAALVNVEQLQLRLGNKRPQPGGAPLGTWGIIVGSQRWKIDETEFQDVEHNDDLLVRTIGKLKDEVATVAVGPEGSSGHLELTFKGGSRLIVEPDPDRSPHIAMWEVVTPDRKTVFASCDGQLNIRDSTSSRG